MDVYQAVKQYLAPVLRKCDWPELQTVFEHMASRKPYDWQLPLFAGRAVGGDPEQVLPAAAAVACLQISIILVDDLLDADPRGAQHEFGEPVVANMALAFQAMGQGALRDHVVASHTQMAAGTALNQMMLTTAAGQHLDLKVPADEAAYWRLVQTKSTPFFAAALSAGALFGGADEQIAGHLARFGQLYGEMIQIQDDMLDTMERPAGPDWLQGRRPLPILFAQGVDHAQRERFQSLRQALPDEEALAEAQTILLRCGAISYCMDQLISRYQQAQQTLTGIPLVDPAPLQKMLASLLEPVQALLAEISGSETLIVNRL